MTQGINPVFAQRRERFFNALSGGVAVFSGAPETVRNNDVHHPYRQDSDFLYLTGFTEPGAYLVLDGASRRYTLFVQPKDPAMERWTGRRVGVRGARSRFGADAAFDAGEFKRRLPDMLAGHGRLFFKLGGERWLDELVTGQLARFRGQSRTGAKGPTQVIDPSPILGEARLLKCDQEVEWLQQAVDLTADGHLAAMEMVRPGAYEYQVEAEISYRFRTGGADGLAYSTICGSGVNATILHHIDNDRRMRRGELLLIDAGAEYRGYAGDVTRTLPVSGVYSDAQRALYRVVLKANKAAIAKVRPGVTFDQVHRTAVRELVKGLVALGLLTGKVPELIKKDAHRRFYMHRTSHWLGLDVHDVGSYHTDGKSRTLEPGMVLTVEPGLYTDQGDDLPKPFRNLGIRIEDDVLVTDGAPRVLSAAIPKEVDDIERIMARG